MEDVLAANPIQHMGLLLDVITNIYLGQVAPADAVHSPAVFSSWVCFFATQIAATHVLLQGHTVTLVSVLYEFVGGQLWPGRQQKFAR